MSATIRLPAGSSAAVHEPLRPALVAGPPSPSGVVLPVPAGVVSWSVAGLIFLIAAMSPMYRPPPANLAPHGLTATVVDLAGPPTPPAIVMMVPAGAAAPAWLAPARMPPSTTAAMAPGTARAHLLCSAPTTASPMPVPGRGNRDGESPLGHKHEPDRKIPVEAFVRPGFTRSARPRARRTDRAAGFRVAFRHTLRYMTAGAPRRA